MASPELAVAVNTTDVPAVCAAMAPKVIVCDAKLTVKLCDTVGDAA